MQGVIKSYDPSTGTGVVITDTDLSEFDLSADALAGSIFRMVRQGQRVVFELDADGRATTAAPGLRDRHGNAGLPVTTGVIRVRLPTSRRSTRRDPDNQGAKSR